MIRIVVATGNANKVEEFKSLLSGRGFEVVPADFCGGMPDVVEDGDSFAANAAIKARALRGLAPEHLRVLADDSGLEVDALGGDPGIHSARYAGESASDLQNRNKLLCALKEVAPSERTARFRCVLCLIDPEGGEHYFDGSCEGHIATVAKGDSGFGYDPVFIPKGYDSSLGELSRRIKSQISHRSLAVRKMEKYRNYAARVTEERKIL